MLCAPFVSHHCTTPPSPCIWYGPVLQNTQLVIFFFKEEGLGERDACWLVGSKNAREKKNIARENSRIFGRETYFLPVKKTQNLAVKKKYAREKSEKNRKTRA